MKYAIISDIHGNIHAFKAVLADAKACGVDMYLFIGDYASSFPWGNDVMNEMCDLRSKSTVIKGNGEDYLIGIKNRGQTDFTCQQFKPVYWAYNALSVENMAYISGLSDNAIVSDKQGGEIHLMHSMDIFYRNPKIEIFHSRNRRMMMTESPFSHEEYLIRAKEALLSCSDAVDEIQALPKGIYLFGHNHMQFHMEYDGRLFINPGSCGEPLDGNTKAAYTLLSCENGRCDVLERRVEYDLNLVVDGLITSGFADYSPEWSRVVKLDLLTGMDYFMSFVMHLIDVGRKMGETGYYVSNEVWNVAVGLWDEEKI